MIIGTNASVDRLRRMKDVLEIQQAILKAARKSLEKMGFLEIIPPVLSASTDPGLRGAGHFEVDFYGKKYKLTASMIMHKIVAASALGKVFALSPCLRKEEIKSVKTGRHLSEFWQIDVEMIGSREEAMKVSEKLLRDIIRDVVSTKSEQLKRLGRKIEVPKLPFKRITHTESLEIARELGFDIDDKEEIPWEAEKAISRFFGGPFFVVDYPKGSRGFYDKTVSSKQMSFDLIYPEGFGEAVSGSEREVVPSKVVRKLQEVGQDVKEYQWFIDLIKKKKIKQTSGFGFGLERLTRYLCGLRRIEQATPFPKLPGGGVL